MLITLFGSTGRTRLWVTALALVVLAAVLLVFRAGGGFFHDSQRSVVQAQKAAGFVPVGTFGKPEWPALIVGRDRGIGEVDFVTSDGQPHRYRGFSGAMQALHFRSLSGRAFTLVFHQHSGKRDPLAH
ncbi:hypothetical protein [Azonexus sp.]|uniref:hypothetical protein n=1 Tax=Azonexus sp. TaxID=1872668 RepID=UPI0027BAD6F1|nr:hypothetical protein [Azonexus sp.]